MNFKSMYVEGRTIDEVWFKLLVEVCNSGRVYKIDSGSFAGDFRLEFDFVTATITNPVSFTESGVMLPLAVTVPQGCPAPTSEDEITKYFNHKPFHLCQMQNSFYQKFQELWMNHIIVDIMIQENFLNIHTKSVPLSTLATLLANN
jgi:thymidylate synthase